MRPEHSTSPYAAPLASSDARPSVIVWYRAYAAFMTLVAASMLVTGIVLATRSGVVDEELSMLLVALLSTVLVVLCGVATLVPYRPWGWTVGVVVLGLGLTSCTIVVALPLLVYWLKPKTKAAFGRL